MVHVQAVQFVVNCRSRNESDVCNKSDSTKEYIQQSKPFAGPISLKIIDVFSAYLQVFLNCASTAVFN